MENQHYDFGEIFNQSKEVFLKNISPVLIYALIMSGINYIISILAYMLITKPIEALGLDMTINTEIIFTSLIMENLSQIIITFLIFLALMIIIGIIALYFTTGIIDFFHNEYLNKNANFSESLERGKSKILPLILTGIIMTIFVMGLSLLLIIPGIIFFIYWSLYNYSIILRNKKYIEALNYSKKLIQDNWWRTLSYGGLLMIIIMIINIILGIIIGFPIGLLSLLITSPYISPILAIPLNILSTFTSFFIVVFMMIYFLSLEKEKGLVTTNDTNQENQILN